MKMAAVVAVTALAVAARAGPEGVEVVVGRIASGLEFLQVWLGWERGSGV